MFCCFIVSGGGTPRSSRRKSSSSRRRSPDRRELDEDSDGDKRHKRDRYTYHLSHSSNTVLPDDKIIHSQVSSVTDVFTIMIILSSGKNTVASSNIFFNFEIGFFNWFFNCPQCLFEMNVYLGSALCSPSERGYPRITNSESF